MGSAAQAPFSSRGRGTDIYRQVECSSGHHRRHLSVSSIDDTEVEKGLVVRQIKPLSGEHSYGLRRWAA